jgi:hypothetical protein
MTVGYIYADVQLTTINQHRSQRREGTYHLSPRSTKPTILLTLQLLSSIKDEWINKPRYRQYSSNDRACPTYQLILEFDRDSLRSKEMSKRLSSLCMNDLHGWDFVIEENTGYGHHSVTCQIYLSVPVHQQKTRDVRPCSSRPGAFPSLRFRSYRVTEYWCEGISSPPR